MATHSSILAWEIPWIEDPGGLQSMGCKESDTTEHTHTEVEIREETAFKAETVSFNQQSCEKSQGHSA